MNKVTKSINELVSSIETLLTNEAVKLNDKMNKLENMKSALTKKVEAVESLKKLSVFSIVTPNKIINKKPTKLQNNWVKTSNNILSSGYLTIKEVAKRTGLTNQGVRFAVWDGRIKAKKINGVYALDSKSAAKFIMNHMK